MTKAERATKLAEDRALRKKMKRPRDWRECGISYVIHAIQGIIAGGLAVKAVMNADIPLAILSGTITGLYTAYQGISYARKKDTPGRDLMDFGIGWGVGVVATYLFNLL